MPNNPKNLRRCIACREHADKSAMVRLVFDKTQGVIVDYAQNADGRGAWIHLAPECLKMVVRKKLLNVVFKRQVEQSVYDKLVDLEKTDND
ncbi:MAG: YlxR family protein [Clostridia bacterium]|nr:YlxR family protein [Clostridia bacterium]